MFGWFRSPECPIEPEKREWIDRRWAWLEEQFGPEKPREAQAVLPRAKFFPEPFHSKLEDAQPLLNRVCGYLQLNPQGIAVSVFHRGQPPLAVLGHEHSPSFCQKEDNGFRIWIEARNLADANPLVVLLARELGEIHLHRLGKQPQGYADREPLSDLVTVYFGLGVITANGALHETHSGLGRSHLWQMSRHSHLNMRDFGYALALFARSRRERRPHWRRELRADVRSAFGRSQQYLVAKESAALHRHEI